MKRWNSQIVLILLIIHSCSPEVREPTITTESFLTEMTDLRRLPTLSNPPYRTIQFSSYDRRSKSPEQEGWFSNDDGFGGETIPGFEEVLKEPDGEGTGEYLICDIQQPGAIVRLWTAGITGRIRLYLDHVNKPFYEGPAADFFWNTPKALVGKEPDTNTFRQFDAVYYPIPFSKRCRLEWIGNISELHFYHVEARVYDPGTLIRTFSKDQGTSLSKDLKVQNPDVKTDSGEWIKIEVPPMESKVLWQKQGSMAILRFSVQVHSANMEAALRKSVLKIHFDHSPTPQVESPLGDFFGAAPGINPFQSLPFSVNQQGVMTCRFFMPFGESARITVENLSDEPVQITTQVSTTDFPWEEGKTMHFRARWKINHELTASDSLIWDMPFLLAFGKGRVVGAASYVYNPSNVPTSWGNWWGEGDEKIFVDADTFPSFFGTGSEDYYNYSWSSARIFSHPYCGQPRNDGPGNRGYVSNYRWHILDDIPFDDKLAFYMELRSHGPVPDFSYGRIVYFYALPGLLDDYQPVTPEDVRDLPYREWNPEAYLGSAGYRFVEAEDLLVRNPQVRLEKGQIWAGGKILIWKPERRNDRITLILNVNQEITNTHIGFTLAKQPGGGAVSLIINGNRIQLKGESILQLIEENQTVLDNFFSGPVTLKKGRNEIQFENACDRPDSSVGIDFIWLKANEMN